MEREPATFDAPDAQPDYEASLKDDAFLDGADDRYDQQVDRELVDDGFQERPKEDVQAVLDHQVGRIHNDGRDYYDKKALESIALATKVFIAGSAMGNGGASFAGNTSSAVSLGIVSATIGNFYNVYTMRRQPKAAAVNDAPVVADYKLECLADNTEVPAKSYKSTPADALVVAIPRDNNLNRESGMQVLHMVAESKADRLAMPAGVLPDAYTDDKPPLPLSTVLQSAKRGLLSPLPQDADRPYIYVSGEKLQQLREELALDHRVDQLIGSLARRYPNLDKPADGLGDPADVAMYARTLRPYALQSLQDVHCNTEVVKKTDEEGVRWRSKTERYAIPAEDSDAFRPALWVYDNSGATLAQKHDLRTLTTDNETLADLIQSERTPNQQETTVLVKELLEELERLTIRKTRETDKQPAISSQPGIASHEFKTEMLSVPYRTKVAKHLGRLVAASAVVAAAVAGIAAAASESFASHETEKSGSEVDSTGSDGYRPWKLQPLNGADTGGYYVTEKNATLLETEDGLRWLPAPLDERGTRVISSLAANEYADKPAIQVDTYAEEGAFSYGLNLPIKYGTAIRDLEITDQTGAEQDYTLLLDKDGTATVYINRHVESTLKVDYELVEGVSYGTNNAKLLIPTAGEGHPSQSGNGLSEAVKHVETFQYDTTEKLDELLERSPTVPSFEVNVDAAKIANCDVAATRTLIDQYQTLPGQPVNYATGYNANVKSRYLSIPHAWVDIEGTVVDPTPPLRGRTPEEAGLHVPSDEELDKQWQDQTDDFNGKELPWERTPLAVFGGLALAGIMQRGRYTVAAIGERVRNRTLSEAQAGRVLSHAAFGDEQQAPDLTAVSEDLSDDALPTSTLRQAVVAPQRVASYLSGRQADVLATWAQRILQRRGES